MTVVAFSRHISFCGIHRQPVDRTADIQRSYHCDIRPFSQLKTDGWIISVQL